jgi:signal peptidase I
MNPTFISGDFIIASQVSYGLKFPWIESVWFKSTPQKGDLIIFTFKNKPSISYIKRVVAIEGEQVDTARGPQKVGVGEVYVLSDNREVLEDSRDLGMVAIERIESQAKMIWFSFSPNNEIRWNRILTRLQ